MSFKHLLTVAVQCRLLVHTISVTMMENRYFTVNPEPVLLIAEGEEVVLHCEVNNPSDMELFWYMDDDIIVANDQRYQLGTDLVIKSVSRQRDSGYFYCEARNIETNIRIASTSATLNITWISQSADVSLRKPKDGNVTLGDEVALKCDVDGSPAPQISWYKNKIRVFDEEDNEYRFLESRLKILSVSSEYNGVYTCEGENGAGEAKSGSSYLLNVRDPNSAFLKDNLFLKTTVTVRDADVWLHCEFENAVQIEWYKWIKTLYPITNDTSLRTTVYNNGTLQISSVRKSDEGTYLCRGTGINNVPQSFTAELQLARLPKFTQDNLVPSIDGAVILAEGEDFEVNCQKPEGIPNPTIRWFNSAGKVIESNGRVTIEGTKLMLNSVDTSHSSNYTCVAENMAGRREITVEVVVTVPPVITMMPSDTDIKEGLLDQLYCAYSGSSIPWTRVYWFKDSEQFSDQMYKDLDLDVNQRTGTLIINKATLNLEGEYKCVVETTGQTPVESRTVNLNVIKKLRFYPQPRSMSLELGSSGSVPCHADAEKPPTIEWTSTANQITLPSGVVSEGGSLKFTNIQKDVAGPYTCIATTIDPILSAPETINATISISVGISPTITHKPQNQTVKEGDDVMVHCDAIGDPDPNINWDKDGHIISPNSSQHYQLLENHSLIILSAALSDDAVYGCFVGNFRGFKRAEMKLTIITNSTSTKATPIGSAGIGITKTIVIAVCSSVAYLALVIGLVAFCSIRLMRKKQKLQLNKKDNLTLHKDGQATHPSETDRLMAEGASNVISNGNGYVMHERYQPVLDSVILEEGERATPSQKSNGSIQSVKRSPDPVQYDRNRLQNIGVLGNGIYGDVFLAKASGLTTSNEERLVCVKRLISRDENVQIEFRAEVEMFRKLDHDRICRLLAICKEVEPIYIIMEYCEWGDLKQFLIATSSNNSQELTIDPPDDPQKLSMCHQVASAMAHLSACRFVHKDLASRNILLEPNLNVKISSLGLSKDIYASEYVQVRNGQLLPLRWTSPEAWIEQDFSTKSDVWSFGCFLYEVFTGADIPYPDRTNEQVIAGYESGDTGPSTGSNMPIQLQTIAYQCWSSCPKERPDFSQIVTMFSSIRMDSRV